MIVRNGSLWFGKLKVAGVSLGPSDEVTRLDGGRVNDFTNPDYEIHVGSGSTPPELSDYNLESSYDSSTIRTTEPDAEVTVSANGNVIFTQSFTNVSNSNVTVSEIGLVVDCSSNNDFLAAREVLAQPRTVAPNETVTFSYEVAFN